MTRQEYQDKLQERLEEGYHLDFKDVFMKAFTYFRAEPVLFFGYTALLVFLSLATIRFQPLGALLNVFLMPALIAGYFTVADKMENHQRISFYDFFAGFNSWLNIFVGVTVSGIFIVLGMFLLVIPGIFLAVSYSLVIPFMVIAKFDYWDAMEASRKLIARNFWNMLGLIMGIILMNFLGLMIFGFGIFISLPLSYLMLYATFRMVFSSKNKNYTSRRQGFDFSNFR